MVKHGYRGTLLRFNVVEGGICPEVRRPLPPDDVQQQERVAPAAIRVLGQWKGGQSPMWPWRDDLSGQECGVRPCPGFHNNGGQKRIVDILKHPFTNLPSALIPSHHITLSR